MAELLDGVAEEGLAAEHQLEAVMVRRVMRAGHHDPAIDPKRCRREVQHRGRPAAGADHIGAALGETVDQRGFQFG